MFNHEKWKIANSDRSPHTHIRYKIENRKKVIPFIIELRCCLPLTFMFNKISKYKADIEVYYFEFTRIYQSTYE